MDPIVVSIAAFFGVAALIGAVAFVISKNVSKAEDRLEIITGKKSRDAVSGAGGGGGGGIMKEEVLSEGLAGISRSFGKITNRLKQLTMLFEQADSPIKADTLFLISAGLGLLSAVIAFVAGVPVPLIPPMAVLPALLPLVWLLWRRKRRFKAFARQLPDALELIARALRSGHSLASGMHVVVEEMPNPISTEFAIAYEEQNLGIPLEQALKNMLNRMPNMDLKFFVTAVIIQKQAGGDMAEILDKIGYIIRERFKIMGQVQALTGEGRISGVVLMALPVALFFAVLYLNPDYVMLLFTEELGRQMIGVAVVLQILGAISIKKIIAIKI
ncbi:MAG: type II secretion system F family protein [Planctomycetaceae bacterium]